MEPLNVGYIILFEILVLILTFFENQDLKRYAFFVVSYCYTANKAIPQIYKHGKKQAAFIRSIAKP